MGPGLNFETPEEIQRIVIEADGPPADGPPAETPSPQKTTKKRKRKGPREDNHTSEVWAHFTKGPKDDDGSLDASCNYCGKKYKQGNQRSTSSLWHHFERDVTKSLDQRGLSLMPCKDCCKLVKQQQLQPMALTLLFGNKKAFSLVLDNSSANDASITELFNTTSIKKDLPVSGAIFHQRYACHILNLIVQDGLSVLCDEIENVRETMKYIRHSQARMEKFSLVIGQVGALNKRPAWDVQTRWNSTYLMLELALELREAINRYATLDKGYTSKPSEQEWERVKALVQCLKPFYVATLKLSGIKYPTLNIFFPEFCEVYLSIKKMGSSPHPFVVQMSLEIFSKWDKYWKDGNIILAIACVLDPRYKLTVVKYYMEQMYPEDSATFIFYMKNCMNELFKEYVQVHSRMVQNQAGSSTQQLSAPAELSDTRAGLRDAIRAQKSAEPGMKSELEEYFTEPLDEASIDDQFDILAWWKVKAPKYPVLARLTRDILAIPISTVASEATFSTSGRTLNPGRSSLND
ncbi:hypothetical protein LUZ63_011712 [Rhynchospora breviuscula]|uniref:BED-type domain-containing protein n=1 Tax=Rhynchospora breviuscula TaxID=2022672 RepID=A0A9Q0CKB0_9POAL|nr:hypothetical protein LUZ63_011712 [Rhynchospora breviuscula]